MCEYEDRVTVLEDIMLHPSSSSSEKANMKEVRVELFYAVLDLCEKRLSSMEEGIHKLEEVLDAKRATS
jgi:hypothetical protein